ncbi:MAG: hypothetical protein UHI93_10570, partial [Acutalibacteraceae bacterium]|nr:hypothetical protein [Acutalibacteraceae bacterium]
MIITDGLAADTAAHIIATRSAFDSKHEARLVKDLRKRMEARQLDLTLTDAAKDYMIDTAFDPQYGARPLKRFIQSNIETLVARKIISEDPTPGTVITIDYDGTGLVAR